MKKLFIFIFYAMINISLCYAELSIEEPKVQDRIKQLEMEKSKLEEVYKEIMIRIDELKQLIAPKEVKEKKTDESP